MAFVRLPAAGREERCAAAMEQEFRERARAGKAGTRSLGGNAVRFFSSQFWGVTWADWLAGWLAGWVRGEVNALLQTDMLTVICLRVETIAVVVVKVGVVGRRRE
jgi:hypothetical protein